MNARGENAEPDSAADIRARRRREAPEGAESLTLATADGLKLRAMIWRRESTQGTVLAVPGRTEFIESYFETAADLLERGFAVAVLDMRNHGLSDRPLGARQKHHLVDFSVMTDDVRRFVGESVAAGLPEPHHLLAHSMGGHVALRYLHDHPGRVAKAVLTAPMVDIDFGGLPRWMVRSLAAGARRLGLAETYALGQSDFVAEGPRRERLRQLLTSDPERFSDQAWHIARTPELAVGGVTFAWIAAALASAKTFKAPGFAEAIATPCLFVLPGADRVVVNGAARAFVRRMPHARLVEIAGARHEILREADRYREQFWKAFDDFMAS